MWQLWFSMRINGPAQRFVTLIRLLCYAICGIDGKKCLQFLGGR